MGLSPHGRGKLTTLADGDQVEGSIPARAGETPLPDMPTINSWVYPRTGGGNDSTEAGSPPARGLSPHGRGKPGNVCLVGYDMRVYPRTGGGNMRTSYHWKDCKGLSPHGRGKLGRLVFWSTNQGSIPARAGETYPAHDVFAPPRVYPRTGGGNMVIHIGGCPIWGLSPHGRGKLELSSLHLSAQGSIPARAGETFPRSASATPARVYPRTGGGNSVGVPVGA